VWGKGAVFAPGQLSLCGRDGIFKGSQECEWESKEKAV
jgi:hypothetical protein